eukprot:gene20646-23452_t
MVTFTLSEASSDFTATDITVMGGTTDKVDLLVGQTATITFTLSEASNNFTASDITVNGGTLTGFAQSATNPLTNCPPADSTPPSIVISSNKVLLDEGETASINFTLSEASTDFTLGDITCLGGTLSNLQGSATPADTTAPTIAISSAKALLAQGETTTVTFTLSEDSSDFSLADITLLGGTLSNFAGSGK